MREGKMSGGKVQGITFRLSSLYHFWQVLFGVEQLGTGSRTSKNLSNLMVGCLEIGEDEERGNSEYIPSAYLP